MPPGRALVWVGTGIVGSTWVQSAPVASDNQRRAASVAQSFPSSIVIARCCNILPNTTISKLTLTFRTISSPSWPTATCAPESVDTHGRFAGYITVRKSSGADSWQDRQRRDRQPRRPQSPVVPQHLRPLPVDLRHGAGLIPQIREGVSADAGADLNGSRQQRALSRLCHRRSPPDQRSR